MGENSKIEWTHHTFNPWWGCVKVSPACEHCYAETFDKRIGGHHWGPASTTPRRFLSEANWARPLKWNRDAEQAGERRRVFCASMADVFEDNDALAQARERLWWLIDDTRSLDWLLLTKRPENILKMVPEQYDWPRNVWVGTTVESQEYADQRIPELLKVPAAVRFLSMEPLLGPVDLSRWLSGWRARCEICRLLVKIDEDGCCTTCGTETSEEVFSGIDWVITGGESGPHARPGHPDWYRSLRDQCQATGVAFHFKQFGEWAPTEIVAGGDLGGDLRRGKTVHLHAHGNPEGFFRNGDAYMTRVGTKKAGRVLDGRTWDEFPASAGEVKRAS